MFWVSFICDFFRFVSSVRTGNKLNSQCKQLCKIVFVKGSVREIILIVRLTI